MERIRYKRSTLDATQISTAERMNGAAIEAPEKVPGKNGKSKFSASWDWSRRVSVDISETMSFSGLGKAEIKLILPIKYFQGI